MSAPLSNIEKAQAALKANPAKRFKRAKAVAAYWREHFGLNEPTQGADRKELIAEYREHMRGIRGTPLKAHVEQTCWECVGGDDDPNPRKRVRDCQCTDCPLHPVRGWQKTVGAVSEPQEVGLHPDEKVVSHTKADTRAQNVARSDAMRRGEFPPDAA